MISVALSSYYKSIHLGMFPVLSYDNFTCVFLGEREEALYFIPYPDLTSPRPSITPSFPFTRYNLRKLAIQDSFLFNFLTMTVQQCYCLSNMKRDSVLVRIRTRRSRQSRRSFIDLLLP